MKRFLLGIIIGTASCGLFLLAHLLLGAVTGVIAICGSASDWWTQTYLYLTVWVLPAALVTAVRFSRRGRTAFYRKNGTTISRLKVAFAVILVVIGDAFLFNALFDLSSW